MKKLSVETEKMYDLNDVQMDQVVGGKKEKPTEEAPTKTATLPDSYADFTDCHTTGDNYTCYSCMTC